MDTRDQSASEAASAVGGSIDGEMLVPLHQLRPGYSPRMHRQDSQDAAVLARSGTPLAPIIVNRATMEVIDGHHRVLAARLRGDEEIRARLFDGTEHEAVLAAIRANIRHGKRLSLAERKRAAREVLARLPHLSDRAISEYCGLSPGTIRGLRPTSTARADQVMRRLGRDGRRRPAEPGAARRAAERYLDVHPTATTSEAAEAAGVSANTVRSARRAMEAREVDRPPAPDEHKGTSTGHAGGHTSGAPPGRAGGHPPATLSGAIARASAGRLRPTGQADRELAGLAAQVPNEWLEVVVTEARRQAHAWSDFADQLEQRARLRRGTQGA